MKLTYNSQFDRYVISECGIIQHTTPDLDAAQRLMGIEPEPEPRAIDYAVDADDEDFDFSDLLEGA